MVDAVRRVRVTSQIHRTSGLWSKTFTGYVGCRMYLTTWSAMTLDGEKSTQKLLAVSIFLQRLGFLGNFQATAGLDSIGARLELVPGNAVRLLEMVAQLGLT